MIYIILIILLIKPFSEPTWPVDDGVILEETTAIRIEMFIKVISQNNIVLTVSSEGTSGHRPFHYNRATNFSVNLSPI